MDTNQQSEQNVPPSIAPEPLVIGHRFVPLLETAAPPARRIEKIVAGIAAIAVTGITVYVGVLTAAQPSEPVAPTPAAVALAPEVSTQRPTTTDPYAAIRLEARAVAVYDVRAGTFLYTKNADERLPLASLTKLMTAYVASRALDQGTRVAVSQNALDTEGDSGLFPNEVWKLKDLISFTLMTSSNDGADALAAAGGALSQQDVADVPEYDKVDSFVENMNSTAATLELDSLRFRNATGLDEPGGGTGGVGNASDMAKLLTHIWEQDPEVLRYSNELQHTYVSIDGTPHVGENTNEYVGTVPGLIASKTGFTDLAGGNLAVLYNAGLDHPIAIVVLGSSRDGRFADVEALVDATYAYVEDGWYAYKVAGSTDTVR